MLSLIKSLYEEANIKDIQSNSFKNFHAVGLNYICLFRSPNLTIKIYIIRPGESAPNKDGYIVCPHSHRYNFQTLVLAGKISNVVFKEFSYGETHMYPPYYKFKYVTPLDNGPATSSFVGPATLIIDYKQQLDSGGSYFFPVPKIHSLKIQHDKYTALLLHQYKDTETETELFTNSPQLPSYDELYQKFSEEEIYYLMEELFNEF